MIEITQQTLSEIPDINLPALFINTATELKEVYAIISDKIWSATWSSQTKDLAALSYVLSELPLQTGVDLINLGAIYFVSGPGSFTSLRTAISVVNTLMQELRIPVFELTTFGYLALRAETLDLPKDTPIILKAGGTQVHQCTANNYDSIVDINDFFAKYSGLVIADLMEKQVEAAKDFTKDSSNSLLTLADLPSFIESLPRLNSFSENAKWPVTPKYHKDVTLG